MLIFLFSFLKLLICIFVSMFCSYKSSLDYKVIVGILLLMPRACLSGEPKIDVGYCIFEAEKVFELELGPCVLDSLIDFEYKCPIATLLPLLAFMALAYPGRMATGAPLESDMAKAASGLNMLDCGM